MKYTTNNGKVINVPDIEVEKIAVGLGISKLEAMQVWLEDAEIEVNEEQEKLDNKAKNAKIDRQVGAKPRKKCASPERSRRRAPPCPSGRGISASAARTMRRCTSTR